MMRGEEVHMYCWCSTFNTEYTHNKAETAIRSYLWCQTSFSFEVLLSHHMTIIKQTLFRMNHTCARTSNGLLFNSKNVTSTHVCGRTSTSTKSYMQVGVHLNNILILPALAKDITPTVVYSHFTHLVILTVTTRLC